jgi:hypothetical protein
MPYETPLEATERVSYVYWMYQALGPVFGLLLLGTGFLVFVGSCMVVARTKHPAPIAAFLAIVFLPLLIGLYGALLSFMQMYATISTYDWPPRSASVAEGIGAALFCAFAGFTFTWPSFLVVCCGLFVRSLHFARDRSRGHAKHGR